MSWSYTIDGQDLLVQNITASCFGGAYDTGDDGQTESGIPNTGIFPWLLGVALPIRSTEAATAGSPLAFKGAHIPWFTPVKVWMTAAGEQTGIVCALIDNGPNFQKCPTHAIDFNPNVVTLFSPTADPMEVANDWLEDGFSYRVIGGAKWIS